MAISCKRCVYHEVLHNGGVNVGGNLYVQKNGKVLVIRFSSTSGILNQHLQHKRTFNSLRPPALYQKLQHTQLLDNLRIRHIIPVHKPQH